MSARSGTETRQRTEQLAVRLTPEEMAQAAATAREAGTSVAAMMRGVLNEDLTAAVLYGMNGRAWYGRNLGAWDDPSSRIGRNQAERDRWLRQARHLLTAASRPADADGAEAVSSDG